MALIKLSNNSLTSITALPSAVATTPAFHRQKTDSQQSIAFETYTKVTFNTSVLDTDSKYDSSNSRFTPTVIGYYYVYGSWGINTSAEVFQMRCDIYKNGSVYQSGRSYSSELSTASVGAIVYLDADDYVEIFARQDRTGSASAAIQHDAGQTFFGAYKVVTT
tara:strand:- start:200 stop:688 length:489 start_codon:yes stop_codon:yes gene_type:complete